MEAVEFSARVKNGTITMPQEYDMYEDTDVKVIVLVQEKQSKTPIKPKKTQKEQLLAVLEQMKGMNMFADIDNPREWQKKLRDEWE